MTIYNVILKKIESNHTNVRTNETAGRVIDLPTVGKYFVLVGESLTPGMDARCITTTEVKSVEQLDKVYKFKTLNSTYELEVVSESEG
jgi:hypothetical protein